MCAKLRVIRPDDPNEPIDQYRHEVESGTVSTLPYERLMIYYRKQKMYKEELEVINKGIDSLRNFYAQRQKQSIGKKINPALKALSNKISKSVGLHDKKGNELFLPDPLPKWIRRRDVTQQKLDKQNGKPARKKLNPKKPTIKKSSGKSRKAPVRKKRK